MNKIEQLCHEWNKYIALTDTSISTAYAGLERIQAELFPLDRDAAAAFWQAYCKDRNANPLDYFCKQ